MPEGLTNAEPITQELPPITSEEAEAFRRATLTAHLSPGMVPPTFVTLFRLPEFEWIDRLEVKVQAVLHAEQEYRFLSPLRVGDRPVVKTVAKSARSRAGMTFLVMESTISCQGEIKVESTTTFVIREAKEGA